MRLFFYYFIFILINFINIIYCNAAIKDSIHFEKINNHHHHQFTPGENKVSVLAGGYGGNPKIGLLVYDGSSRNLPPFTLTRNPDKEMCYFENDQIVIIDEKKNPNWAAKFNCPEKSSAHNNVYWNGYFGKYNDNYSTLNDIVYHTQIINKMYQEWYGVKLKHIYLQANDEGNGYAADSMVIGVGVGDAKHYPSTTLEILGAAYTTRIPHDNNVKDIRDYSKEASAVMSAFTFMSGKTVEYYAYGSNPWTFGESILKIGAIPENDEIIYMDIPSKDCHGKEPGDKCSIDHYSQYKPGMHYRDASGIFRRVFYLLATTKDWNTKKAFDVMIKARIRYWQSDMNFKESACGVIKAAKDLHYNLTSIQSAFEQVGIDTSQC